MKTILGFAAILVTVCGMAACSDEGGENGAEGEGGDGRASTTTATGSGDATGGDGSGGDGPGGDAAGGDGSGGDQGASGDCSGEVGEACGDCCLEANRQGAAALTILMFQHCGCATDAPCAADCDTTDAATDVCADDGTVDTQVLSANANIACVECTGEIDAEAPCLGDVAEACLADEGCAAFVFCANGCTDP